MLQYEVPENYHIWLVCVVSILTLLFEEHLPLLNVQVMNFGGLIRNPDSGVLELNFVTLE